MGLPVAVVTGGSSGIGAEFVRQLAADGCRVLAVARDRGRLEELKRELTAAGARGEVVPLVLDLSGAGVGEQVAAEADRLGGATWLVNCAGLFHYAPFLEATSRDLEALLRVNCEAPLTLGRALLPQLRSKRGHIVNVASLAGFLPAPGYAVYAASKAFLRSWSEALAVELRPAGVGVTVVCPGPVTTPIFERGAPGHARRRVLHEMSPQEVVRLSLAGARRRRVVVIPGTLNRLTAVVSRLMPMWAGRLLAAAVGGTYLGFAPSRRAPSRRV